MTSPSIETILKNQCYACGTEGTALYRELPDRLFGVNGKWTLHHCNNPACGLLWLNPMPTPASLPKLYEDYYTHQPQTKQTGSKKPGLMEIACHAYLQKHYGHPYQTSLTGRILGQLLELNPARTANLDFSTFYLKLFPNGKLLEIGCGNGTMLQNMQQAGWTVTGVDFDPKSVNIARQSGLPVHLGDIAEQNFAPDSFDAIVMSHVIEHLPDPIATLQECKRILRPGGKLIAITPNVKGYTHRYMKQSSLHLDPPRHLHLFTSASLESVANQAGFQRTRSFSTIRDFGGLWWASLQIARYGKYQMGSHIPYIHKLWLSLLAILAGYALKSGWGEGDEIVLEARK